MSEGAQEVDSRSFFDGRTGQYIGYMILGVFLTLITLTIAYPWVLCMMERWRVKHIVVSGQRLYFGGSGGGLIGLWIKWIFLTIITIGIYGLFIPVSLEKWKAKHLSFELINEKGH